MIPFENQVLKVRLTLLLTMNAFAKNGDIFAKTGLNTPQMRPPAVCGLGEAQIERLLEKGEELVQPAA